MKPTAHAHTASRITRRPAMPTPGPAADATLWEAYNRHLAAIVQEMIY